jgi:hypothetical protein
MANTSANTWDEAAPSEAADDALNGADEIMYLRQALRLRLDKEHKACAAYSTPTTGGGEHKAGSAISYSGAYGLLNDTSLPEHRPDGVTDLTVDDNGRLALNTTSNLLLMYVYPKWVPVISLEASLGWLATTGKLTRVPVAGEVLQVVYTSNFTKTNVSATQAIASAFTVSGASTLVSSLVITPKSITSVFVIEALVSGYANASMSVCLAVVEGTTVMLANAFDAWVGTGVICGGALHGVVATAGTLTARTFKLLARVTNNIYYVNQSDNASGSILNAVPVTMLKITEIAQ